MKQNETTNTVKKTVWGYKIISIETGRLLEECFKYDNEPDAEYYGWVRSRERDFDNTPVKVVTEEREIKTEVVEETKGLQRLELKTPAGTLCAETIGDPGAPGIGLYFIPKNHDGIEIELAYAEVKADPDYRGKDDKEGDVDLYIYGNVFRDDWTQKIKYERSAIDHALGM